METIRSQWWTQRIRRILYHQGSPIATPVSETHGNLHTVSNLPCNTLLQCSITPPTKNAYELKESNYICNVLHLSRPRSVEWPWEMHETWPTNHTIGAISDCKTHRRDCWTTDTTPQLSKHMSLTVCVGVLCCGGVDSPVLTTSRGTTLRNENPALDIGITQ